MEPLGVVFFWLLLFGGPLALARGLHAYTWHRDLKKAIRFIAAKGVCRSEELPVNFPHLTAAKLGERGLVQDSWTYGRLELSHAGRRKAVG